MREKDKDPTNKDIKNLLKDFDATSETDLQIKLLSTWNMARCAICDKPVDLMKAAYIGDELPVHKYCL